MSPSEQEDDEVRACLAPLMPKAREWVLLVLQQVRDAGGDPASALMGMAAGVSDAMTMLNKALDAPGEQAIANFAGSLWSLELAVKEARDA